MTSHPALIALPLLLLAACGPAPQKAAAPVRAAPAGDPTSLSERIAPYLGGPLALDEYAVGPLMGATAFDLAGVQRLFPKAVVKLAYLHDGDAAPAPILTVDQGGTQILEIGRDAASGAIGEIRVTGGEVLAPNNETLMMKWSQTGFDPSRCWMGKTRDLNAVICTRKGEPVLRYVFGVPGWTGQTLPPAEMLAAKGFLREFIWKGSSPVAPTPAS